MKTFKYKFHACQYAAAVNVMKPLEIKAKGDVLLWGICSVCRSSWDDGWFTINNFWTQEALDVMKSIKLPSPEELISDFKNELINNINKDILDTLEKK